MKILKAGILISSFFLSTACSNLLDVNNDPARINADQAAVQTLLPSAIQYTANTFFGSAQFGVQYTQYLGGQAISQYTPYGFDQLWRPLYTDALPTLQEIIRRGEAQQAFNYSGVAKILLGLNLMLATDIYGSVPYSQANQGTNILYPCYDPMPDLYQKHIIELLDGGLADLAKPPSPNTALRTLTNDYIFRGAIANWVRVGNAAKARYYLHLSEKSPAALEQAITFANQSMTSNADDLQLTYTTSIQNPWFSFLGNPPSKIMRPSSYLVNMMNGTAQYTGLQDPRLPLYADRGASATSVGVTPGAVVVQPGVTVNVTPNVWHARNIAPLQMLTYPEIKFILAEAYFRTGKPADANRNYREGIQASMDKLGVPAAQATAYLSSPQVDKGAANLQLSDIMLQKYLALYLQMETWTDMRRYQYDPNVYLGLQKPIDNLLPGNPWIQRSNVADEEPGVNTCLPEFKSQGTILWLFE